MAPRVVQRRNLAPRSVTAGTLHNYKLYFTHIGGAAQFHLVAFLPCTNVGSVSQSCTAAGASVGSSVSIKQCVANLNFHAPSTTAALLYCLRCLFNGH